MACARALGLSIGMAPIWLALSAGTALAGAWPRDEGAVFLSFGANVLLFDEARAPVNYDPTVYLEYGLTPRITVGIDGFTADQNRVRSYFAFVRVPLDDGTGMTRAAISIGLGETVVPGDGAEGAMRLGLHWGRPLPDGWLAVDAESVLRNGADRREDKIDATWGQRFAGTDFATILSVQAGTGREGDFYAKLTPSVLWSPGERVSFRIGLTRALTGDEGSGLLLQTWFTF